MTAKPSAPSSRRNRKRSKPSPTHVSWSCMKQRVHNPKINMAKNYSGRNIDMDPRWEKFSEFLADMGERPEGTSLDRRDNNLGYWPANCRWATLIEQRRNTTRNVHVTLRGEKMLVIEALETLGLNWSRYRSARWDTSPQRTAQEAIDWMAGRIERAAA
jgi:hypothetical protein